MRPVDDSYELIDGHRRVEAFRQLSKSTIPAIVQMVSNEQAQVQSIVSNLQRSNLSNLERAIAFEKKLKEGMFSSRKELSKAIGMDETYIGDILNILKMDSRIIENLSSEDSPQDVRLLRMIRNVEKLNDSGPSEKQFKLYNKLNDEKLSRSQLQKEVNLIKKPKEKKDLEVKARKDGFTINIFKNMNKEQ